MAKRVTARDVAQLAGVSRTTVSFILNGVEGMRISEETRQRVLEAARQLDYHPDATARRMAARETRVIGFVLRQSPDQAFADCFLPQVLGGLSQAASSQGYKVMFEPMPPDAPDGAYTSLIRERHVDGIIISGPRSDDQELRKIYEEGAPIVMLGQLPGTPISFVDVDNTGGAALATEHLLNLGHRRIALITNAPPVYTASAARLDGYRLSLAEAGLAYDPALVRYGSFTPQSGHAAMEELLALPDRPSAVFVASDTVALGALQAIHKRGMRVPNDIAVVGFDDIPQGEFIYPPLTTIRLPAFDLGWTAADLLVRLINADEEVADTHIVLETELVVRESCGAGTAQMKSAAGSSQ